jgi:hypothetical protein
MAAGTLTLREIAFGSGIAYVTAAKWAAEDNWPIVIKANRTLGIAAEYDYAGVQFKLAQRSKRSRARVKKLAA